MVPRDYSWTRHNNSKRSCIPGDCLGVMIRMTIPQMQNNMLAQPMSMASTKPMVPGTICTMVLGMNTTLYNKRMLNQRIWLQNISSIIRLDHQTTRHHLDNNISELGSIITA